MANETLNEKLVIEHEAAPLPGYHVVVFEREGVSGERFLRIIPADGPARRGLRLPWSTPSHRHIGYAVDASPERVTRLAEPMTLVDHLTSCHVAAEIVYRVDRPAVVAAAVRKDPLKQLRERVRSAVAIGVRRLALEDVACDFEGCAADIVGQIRADLERFATDLGLELLEIRLGATLGEAQLGDEIARREAISRARRTEYDRLPEIAQIDSQALLDQRRAEHEHRARLIVAERAKALRGFEIDQAVHDGLQQAVRGLSQGVNGIADLRTLGRLLQDARALPTGGGNPASGSERLALQSGDGDAEADRGPGTLAGALHELLAALDTLHETGIGQRRALASALLQVLARALERPQDSVELERATRSANELLDALDPPLPREELARFRVLADGETLSTLLTP